MPSRHSESSSSSRAPLEASRAANRSISASFAGTKASLSSKPSSSRKSSSSAHSSSKSSGSRSASGKHRGRFDDDEDIAEEEEDDQDDGDDYDDEENENHRAHSNARKPSGVSSKSMSRPPSAPSSRQPSASNNANRSVLARSNPNASVMMGGAGNTSVAFHNSRVAALARSHAVVDASSIMRPRGQAAHPAANAAAGSDPKAAGSATASLRVDTSSFEEWMKMATDNKINSTNTWSFALIDYFHDMSLLRNEGGDGSINFQKASCTLDGCVKVWTSRVDSVVVETGKLLSGLQDDIDQATRKDKRGNEDGDDDDADDDGDEDGPGSSTRKRKRNKEATLAKTFGNIQIKKFELEFTVDPLFKKTSADFDEGGASGLLMNHLGVDSSMAVIFDASDVAGVGGDEDMAKMLSVGEDGDAEEEEEADIPAPGAAGKGEDELIDLSKLTSKWLGSSEFGHADGEDVASLLSRRVLCPTLCNFRFSKDDDTPFGVGLDEFNQQTFHTATHTDTYFDSQAGTGMRAQSEEFMGGAYDDGNPLMDGDGADGDFFNTDLNGAADDNDDDGNDFFDALDTAPAFHHGGPVVLDGTTGGVDNYGPFDPSAGPSSELVMAMAFNPSTGMPIDGADGENGGDLFDYFDRRLMRNWAGPEHWKLSRVAATGPLALGASTGAAAQAAAAAAAARRESRRTREPFVIDFLSEEGAVNVKEIFEPAKQNTAITLPASARNKMTSLAALSSSSSADAYLLPEDRHFSSKQLLRLFLKPRVAINMRHKGQQAGSFGGDAQLWADVAADADDMGGADGGMPFDTQFFHDGDDGFDANGGGLDDLPANVTASGDAEDEELTQTLQALNRVKPEYVNYAKKAKRVDVKKLKENIWKELGILASTEDPAALAAKAAAAAAAGEEDADESMASSVAEAAGNVKTFESVLSGLQKAYPQDRMEEISTSFCFICLLHLANEEGLAISTGSEDKIEALRARRGRNSATPTKGDSGGGLFGRLPAGRAMRTSSEDDDLGGEDEAVEGEEGYEEDELRVGRLASLKIMKDPKAYRSA